MVVEQSSLGIHGSLQTEVLFPMMVELEAKNLPPLKKQNFSYFTTL
jgi:hypothetical protein